MSRTGWRNPATLGSTRVEASFTCAPCPEGHGRSAPHGSSPTPPDQFRVCRPPSWVPAPCVAPWSGDAEGEADGESDGDADRNTEGDGDGDGDGDAEADGEAEGEGDGDGAGSVGGLAGVLDATVQVKLTEPLPPDG